MELSDLLTFSTVARLGGEPVRRLRTREVLETVAAWTADGMLNPRVVEVFTLPEARQALRRVEDGHARGKVVITIPAGRRAGEA